MAVLSQSVGVAPSLLTAAMQLLGGQLLNCIAHNQFNSPVVSGCRWQREKELAANRKKGMPSNAPASIVVTDIEKYSELMQSNAPLATKALGIHNSILRRAATAHAGNVVEQEGDSWSVAFHTPTDAVAFCLQVRGAAPLDAIECFTGFNGTVVNPLCWCPLPSRASTCL